MAISWRRLAVVAVLAVLFGASGCALLVDEEERADAHAEFVEERKDLLRWSVSGRAAVRVNGEGATLSLRWQQRDEVFDINLSGPFGAGAVRVSGQPGAVVLNDGSGQAHSAPDPESLFATHTGYDLPVSALRYWIVGLPAEELEVGDKDIDARGRPRQIVQNGWQVEFRRWESVEGIYMPSRIDIQKSAKQLRVALSSWQIDDE
ncbi:lipoprotein insertase outer membrane protein LolB [Halorhodospira halochloris]|nr:lipoprotein insertase outer membrane protein LolB [Halorhodospira halochloris]MCG5529379.1 lipoprotein insertase outer membrane protein LolB [Halorhodospira halochloris]MCG5547354.1 lipoprotein insertase outer membrane protein LolB [Halorhodospira halochloris]